MLSRVFSRVLSRVLYRVLSRVPSEVLSRVGRYDEDLMMMKLTVMLTSTKFALSDAITFAKELKQRCVFDALKGGYCNFFILRMVPLDMIYDGKIVKTARSDLKMVKNTKNS